MNTHTAQAPTSLITLPSPESIALARYGYTVAMTDTEAYAVTITDRFTATQATYTATGAAMVKALVEAHCEVAVAEAAGDLIAA